MSVDSSVIESTETLLKASRVTLVEVVMFHAMKAAKVEENRAAAKEDINCQIRGFGKARIFPITDVHTCLWAAASRIVQGKPPA